MNAVASDVLSLQTDLVSAWRSGPLLEVSSTLPLLSVQDAMAVQFGVMSVLGESAKVAKIGMNKAGQAVAAPVLASSQIKSGESIEYPPCGFSGLEVEIALRLGRDLTPDMAARGETAIMDAIDQYYLGVELLGSRLAQPRSVDFNIFLADNLGSAGYVLQSEQTWRGGTDIEGRRLEVRIDGKPVFSGAAKHPFGGILVALQRYAMAPNDLYGCCNAGQIITTGTLCGVIPVAGASRVAAKIGDDPELEFSITGYPGSEA